MNVDVARAREREFGRDRADKKKPSGAEEDAERRKGGRRGG